MISDAYEAFQAAYSKEADELLSSWHTVNILDSDVSLSQRSVTFCKFSDQFQKLVRTSYLLNFHLSWLSYLLGK